MALSDGGSEGTAVAAPVDPIGDSDCWVLVDVANAVTLDGLGDALSVGMPVDDGSVR